MFAQSQTSDTENILNGFGKKINGQDFTYQSSIPVAKECLLVRATNGKSTMEWETAPVPSNIQGEYVTFAWLAGLRISPGPAKFNVEINGIKKFSFWTRDINQWEEKTEDGSVLSFKKDMIDRSGDRFGFMYLKVPGGGIKKGESLKIKVTGEKFEKESWYMTFKFPLESGLSFKAYPGFDH